VGILGAHACGIGPCHQAVPTRVQAKVGILGARACGISPHHQAVSTRVRAKVGIGLRGTVGMNPYEFQSLGQIPTSLAEIPRTHPYITGTDP
jgi:hypothetical protein